jgi:flagellar biogenesis protein FliO
MKSLKVKSEKPIITAWILTAVICFLYCGQTPAAPSESQEYSDVGIENAGSPSPARLNPSVSTDNESGHGESTSVLAAQTEKWWSIIRAAGATVFIVGLILSATVLLKRYMPHRFGPLGRTKQIHVLESVALGEKRVLTLVEICGSRLLLASSSTNVSLIKEFGGNAIVEVQPKTSVEAHSASKAGTPETGALVFKQALTSELTAVDLHDSRKLLLRLSQIRQGLEAR